MTIIYLINHSTSKLFNEDFEFFAFFVLNLNLNL
jgi:hypothetical protein